MKTGWMLGVAAAALTYSGAASAALFVSEYLKTTDQYPTGVYAEVTHENEYRGDGAWGDYTALDGVSHFYSFNGSADPSLPYILKGDLLLKAGQTYKFSAYVANNYAVSPPVLQLKVDGALVGNVVDTFPAGVGTDFSSGPGPWNFVTWSFTAAKTGMSVVGLVDVNTAFNGNDFSIYSTQFSCGDGRCTGAVPEPSTWSTMLLGFLGVGFGLRGVTRRRGAA
jgi:hypothetical protein